MLDRIMTALGILRYGTDRNNGIRKAFVDGHYYSPIVDTKALRQEEERVWPKLPRNCGIDFNDESQRRWLTGILPKYLADYDYPESLPVGASETQFYDRNSQFSWLDSRSLFAALREFRPRRMIEIGSGYSSLLAADVNLRFLGGAVEITCIEPYPRSFLRRTVPGIARVIEQRVQEVTLETFDALMPGDILFIDSSHVAKAGSDVNSIYFHIIPRLRAGVIIHIHDIFLPQDYPRDWVIDLGIHWNEQYLVQALLMHPSGFEVMFGCAYAQERLPELVSNTLGGQLFGGGSLWLKKLVGPHAAAVSEE